MIIEYKNWQLRPYSNGLCWELYEYKEVKPKDSDPYLDWVFTGKYPSNLSHGLFSIYELALKRGDDVTPLEDAMKTAKSIERDLKKIVKGA